MEPCAQTERELVAQVESAYHQRQALAIQGGGSKHFYARHARGQILDLREHRGIVSYAPSELVVTVKAGTRVVDLQQELQQHGQMLGFEPPLYSPAATIGGAVASGLAGCARPYRGGVRDFVLGVRILTGRGESMRFGGQVLKNVAGFDHARLMVGALGTLGVLLDISLRLVPRPQREVTLQLPQAAARDAIHWMNQLAARPLPLSAAAWLDGVTRIRLSGSAAGVESALADLPYEVDAAGDAFWQRLNQQQLPFFAARGALLRVSVDAANPVLLQQPNLLVDWGGAQRWLVAPTTAAAAAITQAVDPTDGHWSVFRGGDRAADVFSPLSPALMRLHQNLKAAFDPGAILNPGRMYEQL